MLSVQDVGTVNVTVQAVDNCSSILAEIESKLVDMEAEITSASETFSGLGAATDEVAGTLTGAVSGLSEVGEAAGTASESLTETATSMGQVAVSAEEAGSSVSAGMR